MVWKAKCVCVAYIDNLTAAALSGGKWHAKLILLCLNCLYVIAAMALILSLEILRRIEISMNEDCR